MVYTCTYIYRERERERESGCIDVTIYMYTSHGANSHFGVQVVMMSMLSNYAKQLPQEAKLRYMKKLKLTDNQDPFTINGDATELCAFLPVDAIK